MIVTPLTEFYSEIKYKKDRNNTPSDVLSMFNSISDMIIHDYNRDITVFDPEVVKVEL